MAKEEAPRKTTTYNRFEGMNSQDDRYGCRDEEFFWLENIMWVGEDKLHSVMGPGPVIVTLPIAFLLLETGAPLLLETNFGMLLNG